MSILFDVLLGLALLGVAGTVFWSANLFRAVVMFIVFGLLLALVWVRLQAPDLALAEAAIGAGLTGVLLLDAIGHLQRRQDHSGLNPLFLPLLASAGVAAMVISAILLRPTPGISLADQVADALPQSGVEHPITAVLLNFRSYDTLLEIAVLLIAVVVAMALSQQPAKAQRTTSVDPLLAALVRRLLPLMVMVAAYVLWAGSYQTGGAFQAGAVLAAAGVLARMAGFQVAPHAGRILHLGLALGFLVFLTVAASTMLGNRPFLTYPEGAAGQLIFFIEAMLTLSIGVILFSLFVQAPNAEDAYDD